jgi:hypothetical protein
MGSHAEKPRRFLYCHALELYLKALLRQKHSMATVRKLGHRIRLLAREAETLELVVSDSERAVRALIDVIDTQLDALEVRGYLDPDRRGDLTDECDAIEMYLADSLNKR